MYMKANKLQHNFNLFTGKEMSFLKLSVGKFALMFDSSSTAAEDEYFTACSIHRDTRQLQPQHIIFFPNNATWIWTRTAKQTSRYESNQRELF